MSEILGLLLVGYLVVTGASLIIVIIKLLIPQHIFTIDEVAEYKVFPRMLAVAERAWHAADWAVPYNYEGAIYNKDSGTFTDVKRAERDADFNRFGNLLAHKELAKLDQADVFYRIPTVGAVIKDGKLHANVIFPGLAIEYRGDGGKWMAYSKPVAVSGSVEVRARSADGKRPGRSLMVK